MRTKIKCLGDNILIRLPEIEEKTEGGIIKDQAMIEAEQEAMDSQVVEVVEVGEKVTSVKKGDKVLIRNPRVGVYMIDGVRYGGIVEYDIFSIVTQVETETEVSA